MDSFNWLRKSRGSELKEAEELSRFFALVSSQERFMKKVSRRSDLSCDGIKIMTFLKSHPEGVTTSEILAFYNYQRSNLSRAINYLKSLGLIEIRDANRYGQYGTICLLDTGDEIVSNLAEECFKNEKENEAFMNFLKSTS